MFEGVRSSQNPAISVKPSEKEKSPSFFLGSILGKIIQWITKILVEKSLCNTRIFTQ
ncbi:hypothetical protein PsAD2_03108 [Pseudovibrio axinellae]|uniref:Uncharacterized protein n=1 Tax=Pseudovibrio axinellae TaxID=989403 RepID=A0A165XCK4_9HYPH|nr:hypothetical protein PsAD2_03108 [Pseudovibrio axinellae]SER32319.1 hypothetical protein SAMN05421798_10842 [Pseudovibrio axinellae]